MLFSSKLIPVEVNQWLFYQLLIMLLIGFNVNLISNYQAVLEVMETDLNIVPNSSFTFAHTTNQFEQYQLYVNRLQDKTSLMFKANLILYFIVSPLINFYFGTFVFPKMKKLGP